MRELIIIGAGGFGRELAEILETSTIENGPWHVAGFLDDDPHALDGKRCSYPILGRVDDWKIEQTQGFALAIGKPATKQRIAEKLCARGAYFPVCTHKSAFVSTGATIGQGCILYPNAVVGPDTTIGDFVTLLGGGVGHDASIGDYSTISSYCDITGGCALGKRVFLASHATLVPNTQVGDDAYIGAGSVVIRRVKAGTRVFGNPAKIMEF